MSVTRRSFLKSGATTVLVLGLACESAASVFGQSRKRPGTGYYRVPFEAQQAPTFFYTRATFEPYIGGVFLSRGVGGGTVNLTLVAVHDWNPKPRSKVRVAEAVTSRTDCFSLVFRASDDLPELTTIYRIEHGALGTFDLFMTRSEDPQGQIFYEAVINHLIR
jgi:hypothetical protein